SALLIGRARLLSCCVTATPARIRRKAPRAKPIHPPAFACRPPIWHWPHNQTRKDRAFGTSVIFLPWVAACQLKQADRWWVPLAYRGRREAPPTKPAPRPAS